MQFETLNCPMCGASARSDSTRCEHCGARLAAVACPSCFRMVFTGAKFCSHCGTAIQRSAADAAEVHNCPRCRIPMPALSLGATELFECARCDGLWVDTPSFERICAEREQQTIILGAASSVPKGDNSIEPVRYIPCPKCQQLMHRVNFANCSGVIVDVCKPHGTWFDRDELSRIIHFIQRGGMDVSRARKKAELEAQERRLKGLREGVRDTWETSVHYPISSNTAFDIVAAAADLCGFFRS